MNEDLDHGTGAADHFLAEDLERLYRMGGKDPDFRIRGSELNAMLLVERYVADAWYVIDGKKVKRL